MYINKCDKNNMQTSGNDDIILVLQIRKKALKAIIIKAITYFHSCDGFVTHNIYGRQYIIKRKDITDFQYHRLKGL